MAELMDAAPLKILLVEDNPADVRLLREYLSDSPTLRFELEGVESLAAALQTVQQQCFDLVLVDLSLPDCRGLATFQRLRQAAPNTAIVVLSGLDDEGLAISAVREGAQDYLVKGRIEPYLLTRALRYAVERHRFERALKDSEAHYRHLLESITDYTYTVTLQDGRPVRAVHGPGCVAVTGFSPEEYQTQPDLWYRMVHEADRAAVLEQAARVCRGETPAPLEHRILHKNGQVRWVRATVVPRHDASGRLVAYDGLISDITDRKRAEEQLVASEAFYHSLVEHLPQNILRKDLQGRFTFANQRFCDLLGRPLQEILGKTDFDFYPTELAAKYQRDDRHVIATGQTFDTVEENVKPNGEKIYVHVVKTPIYDAQRNIIGIQGIFWDITERIRAEAALRKANEALAQSEAALRRTNEELKAAQMQLIQAEKMESIGTLAAGVAHEVKNPLATLMMGVEFLMKRLHSTDPTVAQVLADMQDAILRADSITRALVDYSANTQLALAPEDLNKLIEEALKLVRPQLDRTHVQLVRNYGADLPPVAADRTRLQQVFVNLLINALQAMPQGGTLTVRTYLRQTTETSHFEGSRKAASIWAGDTVVVAELDDTGVGIPQENLVKIFDPFFTTKPAGEGTGLGLPVSRKIIELHGGILEVKNRPEGGVRASVTLKPHRRKS